MHPIERVYGVKLQENYWYGTYHFNFLDTQCNYKQQANLLTSYYMPEAARKQSNKKIGGVTSGVGARSIFVYRKYAHPNRSLARQPFCFCSASPLKEKSTHSIPDPYHKAFRLYFRQVTISFRL